MADESDIPTPPAAGATAAKAAKGTKKASKAVKSGGAAVDINQVDAWVSRMRTYGGLAGFGLVVLLSRMGGTPWSDAILRGLIGALILSFVAWWCTLLVFRALIRSVEDTQRELRILKAQQERDRARERMSQGSAGDALDAAPADSTAPQ